MKNSIIVNLNAKKTPYAIGKKAENLHLLMKHGFPVPFTMVIPWEFHERYQANDTQLVDELKASLSSLIDPDKSYAVRSSANIEDSIDFSFAGQFKSVLHVKGVDKIIFSAWSIWATSDSTAVKKYLETTPNHIKTIKMAVIVQEMVQPIYSGVAFSRNPMTGTDEIVIEAVEGDGQKLVQTGITPHRWIYKWGKWLSQPVDEQIPSPVIQEVVNGVKQISKALKKPVDVEWVFDGRKVWWVQVRDITTFRDINIYSNRISKEMMPGQIQPLIWSINIPLIIPIWINILNEMVGETHLKPEDLAKRFHHRSYFNMGILGKVFNLAGLPSEGLEMMMGVVPGETGRPAMKMNLGMLRLAPRLLLFLLRKWTLSRRYQREFPQLIKEIRSIPVEAIPELKDVDLIKGILEVLRILQKIVFYNVHVPLLLSMYGALFFSQLKKAGVQPQDFDLLNGLDNLDRFNPNNRLRQLRNQFERLDTPTQNRILSASYAEFEQMDGIQSFQQDVKAFLSEYGHLSNNNNNFSTIPWREQPDMILKMILSYPPDSTPSPKLVTFSELKSKSSMLSLFYRRTREYRYYKEVVGDTYTYGYGLLRPFFMALAQRFVERGWMEDRMDIFFLEWSEIQAAVRTPELQTGFTEMIKKRRAEMLACADIELPPVIFGDEPPPTLPVNAKILRGTPTSAGYYCGPARLVRGIEDFGKVMKGDILVIPFSEAGWTPLFAKAGAVVSESGGILSHSSIIAREYHIPAVVSVPEVMKLKDFQIITVDGYKGEVMIHQGNEEGE